MRLIGPPSASRATVAAAINQQSGVHQRFVVEMFEPLWSAGLLYGIDPVGVVAQSAKETGWGNFTGNVKAAMCNPCGLKNRESLFPGVDDGDRPLAHARFANWTVGAMAHVQHLCAYAGQPISTAPIVDPRYVLVSGTPLENFEDLGGRWAPAADYGTSLVAMARRLQGATP